MYCFSLEIVSHPEIAVLVADTAVESFITLQDETSAEFLQGAFGESLKTRYIEMCNEEYQKFVDKKNGNGNARLADDDVVLRSKYVNRNADNFSITLQRNLAKLKNSSSADCDQLEEESQFQRYDKHPLMEKFIADYEFTDSHVYYLFKMVITVLNDSVLMAASNNFDSLPIENSLIDSNDSKRVENLLGVSTKSRHYADVVMGALFEIKETSILDIETCIYNWDPDDVDTFADSCANFTDMWRQLKNASANADVSYDGSERRKMDMFKHRLAKSKVPIIKRVGIALQWDKDIVDITQLNNLIHYAQEKLNVEIRTVGETTFTITGKFDKKRKVNSANNQSAGDGKHSTMMANKNFNHGKKDFGNKNHKGGGKGKKDGAFASKSGAGNKNFNKKQSFGSEKNNSSKKKKKFHCFKCHGEGHYSHDCPSNKNGKKKGGGDNTKEKDQNKNKKTPPDSDVESGSKGYGSE